MPDVFGVFADRAVGGEDAGLGDIDQRHPIPFHGILIDLIDLGLGLLIGIEISQYHIGIGADEVTDDGLEVLACNPFLQNGIQKSPHMRIVAIKLIGMVAIPLPFFVSYDFDELPIV